MRKLMEKGRLPYIIASLILLISTIIACFYINEKAGYYVDEGMTLVLSNGEFNGAVTTRPEYGFGDFVKTFILKDSIPETISNVKQMLTDVTSSGNYSVEGTVEWYDAARSMLQGESTWVSGEELYNQLVAEKGNRFNYSQVYINQAVDVHPPLYYFIVHTVFSVFAGKYSKLFLFAINIIFLLITAYYGFKLLLKQYDKRSPVPYLFLAIYSLSQGYFSCASYFRMYAMLTCMIMLTIYWHVTEEEEYSRKSLIRLAILVIVGFGTQYYYIIFLAPLFVFNSYILIRAKRIKDFLAYLKTMIISGIISLICWPFSLYHILFGYRGTEAMKSIAGAGFGKKMLACLRLFKKAVFLNSRLIMLLCLIIIVVAIIISLSNKTERPLDKRYIAVFLAAVLYFITVAKIAPANSMRYFMCIHPVILIVLFAAMKSLGFRVFDNKKWQLYASASVLALAYMLISLLTLQPDYLYLDEKDLKLGISEDASISDLNCLMIAMQHGEGFPLALKLSEYKEVMVVDQDKLDLLKDNHPSDMEAGLLVYIDENCKLDEDIEIFTDYMELDKNNITAISSDIKGFKAYYVR